VVLALHPTPAVCGVPTDRARAFIQRHEAHARDLYCGFWGPWNPDGRTELFVNIRCLRATEHGALLYIGAGITKDSDPQLEWEETERKATTWTAPIKALK
jgi:isochorismate synthase